MSRNKENVLEEIRKHPLFQSCYEKLERAEENRQFCRHQMNHLLDVARLAYIQNLEQGLGIRREVIYAAALLHDIGKYRQYAEGVPHEQESAKLAEVILSEVSQGERKGFGKQEQEEIVRAIRSHRKYREDMGALGKLIYNSDKKSRQCFACQAEEECVWSTQKKNMEIDR